MCVGVHECTFRVDHQTVSVNLGIVRADKIDMTSDRMGHFGHALRDDRDFCSADESGDWRWKNIGASGFAEGDRVTVKVDLNANNGTPQDIPRGAYFFACDLYDKGEAVTIAERK